MKMKKFFIFLFFLSIILIILDINCEIYCLIFDRNVSDIFLAISQSINVLDELAIFIITIYSFIILHYFDTFSKYKVATIGGAILIIYISLFLGSYRALVLILASIFSPYILNFFCLIASNEGVAPCFFMYVILPTLLSSLNIAFLLFIIKKIIKPLSIKLLNKI